MRSFGSDRRRLCPTDYQCRIDRMNSQHNTIEQAVGSQPTMASDPVLTVYFDGSCALCSVEIGHYARQRGAQGLCFVDASTPGAQTGVDLCRDSALRRFHVRRADGQLVSGARAFVAIWETLPAWKGLARVARLPGVIIFLEGAYRLFLPARPLLSRIAAGLGARPRREDAGAATDAGR
jgi:predicted DCC family thiol-disulfide oxidoreductase YuxK